MRDLYLVCAMCEYYNDYIEEDNTVHYNDVSLTVEEKKKKVYEKLMYYMEHGYDEVLYKYNCGVYMDISDETAEKFLTYVKLYGPVMLENYI